MTEDTWTVAGRTFKSRLIVGTGRYNGRSGYSFVVLATDQGEPGCTDTFQIVIRDGGGTVVAAWSGTIRGNNQSILER